MNRGFCVAQKVVCVRAQGVLRHAEGVEHRRRRGSAWRRRWWTILHVASAGDRRPWALVREGFCVVDPSHPWWIEAISLGTASGSRTPAGVRRGLAGECMVSWVIMRSNNSKNPCIRSRYDLLTPESCDKNSPLPTFLLSVGDSSRQLVPWASSAFSETFDRLGGSSR